MYFRRCFLCGAYLDPGERCDCLKEKEALPSEPEPLKAAHKKNLTNLFYINRKEKSNV